jgi:hypothetical protein
MPSETHDTEIELYRSLIEPEKEFKDAFGWTTVLGVVFCGLVMLPGSIYLALMTGGNLGTAASWVTVILFMEIARRALKPLSRQQLVILLHAANVMMAVNVLFPGGPMGHLIYRAYLVTSDVARDAGMSNAFPSWFCPPPGSPALTERTLLHPDWLVPIAIVAFMMFTGLISRYTLGYFFFRLTSDVENLPFPLAPIAAQGAMALSEAEQTQAARLEEAGDDKQKSNRWRIFALGGVLGMAFGVLQVGIPGLSSLFLAKPFFVLPQPFVDTTLLTQNILPATPTGITLDLGIILIGTVLPFWSVVGTFLAIALTVVLNPLLFHAGIFTRWQPGMDTINTTFANSIDFWMSFGIGTGLGISIICVFASTRDVAAKVRAYRRARLARQEAQNVWATPEGRGDFPLWGALALYLFAAGSVVALCIALLPKSYSIIFFLFFFTFIYSPFISYINARLLGLTGQSVDIPFVKESAFILSGARGLGIWLAPVPVENYGYMAQAFRVNELTGVSFRSLLKTEFIALPVLFVLSIVFWGFIWRSDAVPSDLFPAARVNWELAAKNQVLLLSSTFVPPGEKPEDTDIMESEFMQAIHPATIGVGLVGTIALYTVLSVFGLPIMLVYGMIRGLGQLPHFCLLELVGALFGRLYFQKRFGSKRFLTMAPALLAGYFTGVGLISMATMALMLVKSAISTTPF